jgi:hypothetical protein
MLKIGDIVKVIEQPDGTQDKLLHEVGWISEITENTAIFNSMHFDGSPDLRGCKVPLSHLEPEHGYEWKIRKNEIDEELTRFCNEETEHTKRHKALVEQLAAKHDVPIHVVEDIILTLTDGGNNDD